jgi:hypothetical protein
MSSINFFNHNEENKNNKINYLSICKENKHLCYGTKKGINIYSNNENEFKKIYEIGINQNE